MGEKNKPSRLERLRAENERLKARQKEQQEITRLKAENAKLRAGNRSKKK